MTKKVERYANNINRLFDKKSPVQNKMVKKKMKKKKISKKRLEDLLIFHLTG